MDDIVKFKRIVGKSGDSLIVSIPIELVNYLNTNKGDSMVIMADSGKHGKFISMWVEK